MLHLEKLRKKVEEVCDIHHWYQPLIGKINLEEIANLQDLPLLTSEIVETYYYHQHWNARRSLSVYHTSGTSSGQRKAIAYSVEDEKYYVDIKAKLFSHLLEESGCTKALADMGTGHAAATAMEIFEKIGLIARTISFELPIARHIEELQNFQPDLLYTMPSILERIAAAAENPRSFGIRKIILVGEIASLEWQRSMADRFGIDPRHIIDTYGSIEIGTIAYYDHDAGRYIFVDDLFAEGVNLADIYENRPESLRPDETVLVLTSFVRTMLPALRFVTNDVVRDLRPVIIDRKERQSFQCLVKRIGNEIKHGEKISLYDIEEAVHKHIKDALIRVETNNNKLKVRIKSDTATDKTLQLVQKELSERVPEIGMMIRGGLLEKIEVIASADKAFWEESGIKQKRIYYEDKR